MKSFQLEYLQQCAAADVRPNSSLSQVFKSFGATVDKLAQKSSDDEIKLRGGSSLTSSDVSIDCKENVIGPQGFPPFLRTLAAALAYCKDALANASQTIRLKLILCECNITNENVTALVPVVASCNGDPASRVTFVCLDLRRNVHVSLSGGKALRRLAAQFRDSVQILVDGCSINAALARAIGMASASAMTGVDEKSSQVALHETDFFDETLGSLSKLYNLVRQKESSLPFLGVVFSSAGLRKSDVV